MFGEERRYYGRVWYFRDITEHKQMEAELRKRELLLSEVGVMAKVGGWELDLSTNEVLWTKETYLIHEIPEGEKIFLENGINYYDPEDRPAMEAAVNRTIQTGELFDLECRLITATGHRLWVRSIGRAVKDGGSVVGLVGTFQDITERKNTEAELKKKIGDLERFQKVIMGREERVIELKKRIKELEEK
jgi:PAS domain-containing protein